MRFVGPMRRRVRGIDSFPRVLHPGALASSVMHRIARFVLLVTLAAVVALPASARPEGTKRTGGKEKTTAREVLGNNPTVRGRAGDPPTTLTKKDLIVRNGAEATTGNK